MEHINLNIYLPVFNLRQSVCDNAARRSGTDYHEIVLIVQGSFSPLFLKHGHEHFIEQMLITIQEMQLGSSFRRGGLNYNLFIFRRRWSVDGVPKEVHEEPEEHKVLRVAGRQRLSSLHAHFGRVFGRKRRGIMFRHSFH